MTKKERIQGIIEALDQRYGRGQDATLDHSSPWELLVATMLSAQCTDARVNMVTPDLFRKYPSVNHMAEAVQSELEDTIRSIGFYRAKA
ncbi:MAG: endonuclease III, partial [Lachnospiraceae bacterium]|nr:endonuclease III [Lachnospiraceae bacterium]